MLVYAEGRVERQKRTQTATTLWPFGFVFGVQLGSLEKKKTRRGPVRAALVHIKNPKPSKECTYGVRNSGRNLTYRNLYVAVWLVRVSLVGVLYH